mmetsp:Transcript_58173/g.188272  ORF Transcript_58173/g.188272 Transcript_58173/m.188272 type:complete len:232 (+) Transcript_58173:630-1325(+)
MPKLRERLALLEVRGRDAGLMEVPCDVLARCGALQILGPIRKQRRHLALLRQVQRQHDLFGCPAGSQWARGGLPRGVQHELLETQASAPHRHALLQCPREDIRAEAPVRGLLADGHATTWKEQAVHSREQRLHLGRRCVVAQGHHAGTLRLDPLHVPSLEVAPRCVFAQRLRQHSNDRREGAIGRRHPRLERRGRHEEAGDEASGRHATRARTPETRHRAAMRARTPISHG